jgi:hypothetical protein
MPTNRGPGRTPGIISGREIPSSAARSPQPPPLCRPADAPRIRVAEKRETRRLVERTDDGGVRSAWGEEEGGRRHGRSTHQCRRGAVRTRGWWLGDRGRSHRLRFQSISKGMGSETSQALAGIRERPREFGPNSALNFYTPPNTGIRVRILEFRILAPILYIQTGC